MIPGSVLSTCILRLYSLYYTLLPSHIYNEFYFLTTKYQLEENTTVMDSTPSDVSPTKSQTNAGDKMTETEVHNLLCTTGL